MSQRGAIVYILQETRDSPVYLCAVDPKDGNFYRFPMSVAGCSRLVHECSSVVHSAISGYSDKHSFQEVASLLSKKHGAVK